MLINQIRTPLYGPRVKAHLATACIRKTAFFTFPHIHHTYDILTHYIASLEGKGHNFSMQDNSR